MADYQRATSNPHGEVQQDNPYGVDDVEFPAVGRNNDHFQRGTVTREFAVGNNITAARDQMGAPVAPHNIQDDTIVTIAGIGDMSYVSAVNAGFISPQQGNTPVNPPAPAAAPEADRGDNAEETEEASDNPSDGTEEVFQGDNAAEVESALTSFVEGTDGATQEALIDAAATGSLSDEALATMADGVATPEAAQAVRCAFEGQALDAIGKATGLQGEALQDFVSDLYSDHPEEMARAIRQHLQERSTEGYRGLAAAARLAGLEFNGLPEVGPDVSVRVDRGRVVVGVAGQEYDLATAARLGLVQISHA